MLTDLRRQIRPLCGRCASGYRVDLTTFSEENRKHREIAAVLVNNFQREFDDLGEYLRDVDSP